MGSLGTLLGEVAGPRPAGFLGPHPAAEPGEAGVGLGFSGLWASGLRAWEVAEIPGLGVLGSGCGIWVEDSECWDFGGGVKSMSRRLLQGLAEPWFLLRE